MRFRNIKQNKKSQEEMVGFIVIVVLVTIVAMSLLIFSLRRPAALESSSEIESFVHGSLKLTTECEIYGKMINLQDLILVCDKNEKCNDEEDSCMILNRTFDSLLNSVWNIEEGSTYKGYYLNVYTKQDNETSPILAIRRGNETVNSQASDVFMPYYGELRKNLHVYLKIYS